MGEFTKTEHLDGKVTLYGGDNRDVLKSLPDNSIDSIVCDPPYALVSIQKRFGKPGSKPAKDVYGRGARGFMGRNWDTGEVAFSEVFWAECLRVLKPGGHVVAFSGTRTYHRMAVAIEDAGFEIRDDIMNMVATDSVAMRFVDSLNDAQAEAFFKIMEESQFGGMAGWAYGSGFPKSHDVSKAIDKAAGAEREKVPASGGLHKNANLNDDGWSKIGDDTATMDSRHAATDAAREWQGWGTALKPAWEPICLARKPLDGTVAENVLEHGTGALNIDGCRIGDSGGTSRGDTSKNTRTDTGWNTGHNIVELAAGRWPANIVHDGSNEVVACFPDTGPAKASNRGNHGRGPFSGLSGRGENEGTDSLRGHNDNGGSAARFFYTAKADKRDRIGSKHPTVKPVDLMQWLCRLVTPPGGLVLDPFAGSGSTGEAAWREGFRCILIEREEEYQADIAERLRLANAGPMERSKRAIKQADNDNLPLFGGAGTGGVRGEGRQIYGHFADQNNREPNGRRHNGR